MRLTRSHRTALAFLVACGVLAPSASATTAPVTGLDPAALDVMNQPAYAHGEWFISVRDLATGQELISLNADALVEPGSVVKTYSMGASWLQFGPDHQVVTPVKRRGRVVGGRLRGDLILVGAGDLTMGGRTKPDGSVDYTDIDHTDANDLPGATLTPEDPLAGIDAIAQQVHDAGITHVEGNVVIDPRIFTPPPLDPQPTPLIINDNLIDLLTTPTAAGQPAQLMWRPQVAPYSVTSTVQTVAAGGTTDISVAASPDGTHITLSGTIAADAQPVLRTSGIQDPNAFGRTALIEALGRAGVSVSATPTGPNPQNLLPSGYTGDPRVAAYVSPPYSQYAKLILKVSHNLGANLALCNQAVSQGSTNCFDAFPIERAFLRDVAHVDPAQFQLDDGRGGDATERATPNGLAGILAYWLTTPDAAAFRNSLPILGVDGSNASTCTACPARGKVFAKPGTVVGQDLLNNGLAIADQSQAGYLITDDGRTLIFVVMANGAAAADIQGVVDVFNDSNEISALLQQQASRHRHDEDDD